jgi:hypothetical protein
LTSATSTTLRRARSPGGSDAANSAVSSYTTITIALAVTPKSPRTTLATGATSTCCHVHRAGPSGATIAAGPARSTTRAFQLDLDQRDAELLR